MKNKLLSSLILLLFSIHLSAQCSQEEIPTAQCVGGLVVELLFVDSDGDGSPDDCLVELFARDFNAASFDNTTPTEDLFFYFNANPEDSTMQFNISNLGPNDITIYVEDTDGCIDSCTTLLFIEAGNINCIGGDPEYTLTGQVSTIQDEGINEVEINVSGSTLLTNVNGFYDYGFIGGGFTMSCYKNNNPSNGVTGSDLIIMRQHILTIAAIDNPVYLLAADVNNNGLITTADIVAARQVILGNASSFPNNTSWRFYHGDIETGEIFEQIVVPFNSNSDLEINWTGYKVGDVNGSAEPE